MIKLIEDGKSEEVKFQASRSLGNIASRHPKIVMEIMKHSEKVEDPYPYIFAIKEMLGFSQKEFDGLNNVINWLFQKAEKSDRESNHYVISESIGIIARFSSKYATDIINSIDKVNPIRKFIIASSLRYMLENMTNQDELDSSA